MADCCMYSIEAVKLERNLVNHIYIRLGGYLLKGSEFAFALTLSTNVSFDLWYMLIPRCDV